MRMTSEDKAWLEAGYKDVMSTLAEIEKEIPPPELAEYLASFERGSTPIRWNPRKREFEIVKGKR